MPSLFGVLFAIVVLVLVDHSRAAPAPYDIPPEATASLVVFDNSSCTDIHHCRTMWNIVWSCATTIFLCTWVARHPNLPDPTWGRWRAFFMGRFYPALYALLIPEISVANAAAQWWEARRYKPPFQGWTRTHTYFTLMRGFVGLDWEPSYEGEKRPSDLDLMKRLTPITHPGLLRSSSELSSTTLSRPASFEDLPIDVPEKETEPPNSSQLPTSLRSPSPSHVHTSPTGVSISGGITPDIFPSDPITVKSGHQSTRDHDPESSLAHSWIIVTKEDILDRSKTNVVAKSIAVAQTTWFIIQFLARWAAHQPRTQLEITTLAHAVLNILIYFLCWNKPYQIDTPIHVSGHLQPHVPREDLVKAAPILLFGDIPPAAETWRASIIILLPVVGVLFGGLHCFAWRFDFPTEQNAKMWRVCAVYCTAAPLLFSALIIVGNRDRFRGTEETFNRVLGLGLSGYMTCRLILLVVTISCLVASPPGVFEATPWTTFLPHIS